MDRRAAVDHRQHLAVESVDGMRQTKASGVAGGESVPAFANSTQAVPAPKLTSPSATEAAPSDAAY